MKNYSILLMHNACKKYSEESSEIEEVKKGSTESGWVYVSESKIVLVPPRYNLVKK